METAEEIKQLVREKYSEIALQDKLVNQSSCCGAGGCSTEIYNIMSDDYSELNGYNADADLGLGCGLPTQFAHIKQGDTVVDLGSGAGNDCFIARAEVGETGKVIGIDMTPAMIAKARENSEKLGFNNVEFRLGEIENMPIGGNIADVVVSNCVLNLVPDKKKAFAEIFRVLKVGGHFSISDVVIIGDLPAKILKTVDMYVGCIAGAIQKEEYLGIINSVGFENITIQKEKEIIVPDDILSNFLSEDEIRNLKEQNVKIVSVTVYAEKVKEKCCVDSSCCN